jgi:hypothetical protein
MGLKPQRGMTGLYLWTLPDSQFQITWLGPGTRLLFGRLTTPGATPMHIEHPTARDAYDTIADAQRAVDAFIAAGDGA